MASCGLDAGACATDHWCPNLGAHREKATWRAPCPMGHPSDRDPLSFWVERGSIAWNNHCGCERDDIRRRLAELLPGCVSARYSPRHAIPCTEVIDLVLADIPPQSKYLGLLEAAGMPTSQALAKLGIGPTHKGRVIADLRRVQRLPVSVRKPRSPPLPISVTHGLPVSVSLPRSAHS